MRGTGVWAAAAVAAAIALAGCGGDDGNGGGLSQEELDEQSAEICREGREDLQNLEEPDLSNPQEAEAFLTEALEIFDRTFADLQALEPEEDLQADYNAYLNLLQQNADDLRAILDKAKARDPSGQRDLVQFLTDQQRQRRNRELAREAGLTGCAQT